MQITYEEYRQQTGHGADRSRSGSRVSRKKQPLARREIRRLSQLGISLALFLVVFLGRGLIPGQWNELGKQLRYSADFTAAFAELGRTISAGGSVPAAVGEWCVSVFAPSEEAVRSGPADPERWAEREIRTLDRVTPERWALALAPPSEERETYVFSIEHRVPFPTSETGETITQPDVKQETELPETDNAELGLSHTVTPAMGVVSSGFGYREHPLSGEEKFHNGVDLAVEKGTRVLAFADGVVDFVGKSDAYGNYVQLRHANGVTSFYAHCSELLLPKGTEVKAGDVIALSGDTGNVTGPHLHFELKVDGVRIDPADHIETLAQ